MLEFEHLTPPEKERILPLVDGYSLSRWNRVLGIVLCILSLLWESGLSSAEATRWPLVTFWFAALLVFWNHREIRRIDREVLECLQEIERERRRSISALH